MYVCLCLLVLTHWVDVDEEAMLLLVGTEPLHIVQKHRVGVVEVRMGDEDLRLCDTEEKMVQLPGEKVHPVELTPIYANGFSGIPVTPVNMAASNKQIHVGQSEVQNIPQSHP